MFVARDTDTNQLWFRVRDCAAVFGSLFCVGWETLGKLVRTDVTFLPTFKAARNPFDHALVRDLGLVVLAEWNDPDVWLWLQDDSPVEDVPVFLQDVFALVKEPHVTYEGKLVDKAFSPAPEGWRCSRCGRFPSELCLTGRIKGVPLYACAGQEADACLSS